MQRGRERDGDKRWEREQEKRQRGRRLGLQFVLGSHSASIHTATGASNWIAEGQVGRGRGWGLEEKREKEGGGERVGGREGWVRGRGVMGCKGCRGSPGKWAGC